LQRKFTTFDEPFYLVGGYSYLVTGDTHMVNRYHPPLAQVLAALPLLGLDLPSPAQDPAWRGPADDSTSRALALSFLYRNVVPWRTILTRARLMIVGLGVVTGVLVFLWARELWGAGAGVLALVLYAFSPNLLAHARLTTTDFAVTGLSFGACYFAWRFFRQPGLLRLILAGLVLGLALLAKVSALVFAAALIPLCVLYVAVPPREKCRRGGRYGKLDDLLATSWPGRGALALVAVTAMLLVASGCIWLAFFKAKAPGTHRESVEQVCAIIGASSSAGGLVEEVSLLARVARATFPLVPWPRQYWQLLAWVLARSKTGHPAFLAGEYSQTGWWYFFPVVLAVKTPLPTLILLATAAILGWSRRRLFDRLFLLIPPMLFLAISMQAKINIGYRHILPVLPFLIVFGSQVAGWRLTGVWRKVRWVLVGLLAAWQVAGTVHVWPHYLAYFNETVGGPPQGYKYLVDSNLDWGQDLLGLRDYLRQHHIEKVKLAYFGNVTPEALESLGISYEPVSGRGGGPPAPGVYAISATRLQGAYGVPSFSGESSPPFQWARKLEPEARIGYTIFIYRVGEDKAARPKEQDR